MIDYLNNNYSESISKYNNVYDWFNEVGYNILINDITTTVNEQTQEVKKENGIEKLEKLYPNIQSVISKSEFFPIKINK